MVFGQISDKDVLLLKVIKCNVGDNQIWGYLAQYQHNIGYTPQANPHQGEENVPIKILMKFQTPCNKGLIRETNMGYVALKRVVTQLFCFTKLIIHNRTING